MPNEQVSISVADAFLDRFADVVKRIEQAGLKVDQQLDTIGVITGSIDSDDIGKLDQVEGIAAVERSRGFQLPPPDSPIQ
ncbi:MAG: ketohydroxyglutarate aldolase [Chloroflexi bacterium]|nr:ketohydroxyglutarate aldolase [Chloroflexota bacterium]